MQRTHSSLQSETPPPHLYRTTPHLPDHPIYTTNNSPASRPKDINPEYIHRPSLQSLHSLAETTHNSGNRIPESPYSSQHSPTMQPSASLTNQYIYLSSSLIQPTTQHNPLTLATNRSDLVSTFQRQSPPDPTRPNCPSPLTPDPTNQIARQPSYLVSSSTTTTTTTTITNYLTSYLNIYSAVTHHR
ncbi:hypothetical protein BO70DRAFT_197171 [Aspergillus heteromorphus CBS 117.55]|uniref:Uncharacterized protein n=1 Tax=Aspergillus heteromorphus CBS 117.55 TaxID=1448321 RepID=A0A317WNL3_9EURO|nr:uncharacterized protein BO70DRAFT_197171 [Aspergillus heteromorphus CBS 117.55]PWY87585.1 hypothetical protein BO70DRAFT_197171 [Aspergillus heteromorphus CBS 117.55]